MASNELSFTQLSTILNDITKQATGRDSVAPLNTASFVTVAQTALKTGYDPLLQSISQVLSRTIFSIRPYSAKFKGLQVDNQKFGAITRKLKISDKDWENDQRFELEEGKSVDMYRVSKPKVLQLNFYGQNVFQRHYTIFKDQLDTAFTTPDQFGRFITMVVQNCSDIIEQEHEIMRRATLANLIGGRYLSTPDSVIHLITEYNAETGSAITRADVFNSENFKPFILWVYARIDQLCNLMTERTVLFQTNITGKENMNQHSPLNRQKVYLFAKFKSMINSMVLSEIYHNEFLRWTDNESVAFWQAVDTPDTLNVQPVYLQEDGTLTTGGATVINNLFGVIFDEEAAGITMVNEWSSTTPFNSAGGYSNTFFHFTDRYWNDFTEKSIVLMLD